MLFTFHEDIPSDAAARVDEGLGAFNAQVPALRDVHALAVFAHDRDDAVIGGAVGRTWGTLCELQQLWVAEGRRGEGIARELMARFERAATRRACELVYLDTFDFQAPGFYQHLGYLTVLERRGYTGDVVRYTMEKTLPSI